MDYRTIEHEEMQIMRIIVTIVSRPGLILLCMRVLNATAHFQYYSPN